MTVMNLSQRINALWIGSSMPPLVRACLRSHLIVGHRVHLYTYRADGLDAPSGVIPEEADSIIDRGRVFRYPMSGSYAGFANLFRYALLREIGGWWSDCDVIAVQPWDALPNRSGSRMLIPLEERRSGSEGPTNCVLYAAPGHPLVERCYEIALEKDTATLTWGETGPLLFSSLLKERVFSDSVELLDVGVFCPVSYWNLNQLQRPPNEGGVRIGAETFGIHLYNEMWRRRKFRPKMDVPEGSAWDQYLSHLFDD